MKKSILILIILLFVFSNVIASDYWKGGRGAWDISYVFCAGIGYLYLDKYVTDNIYFSVSLGFGFCILKETCDELYKQKIIKNSKFLDNALDKYKGFSWGDVGRTGIGITIVLPLRQ